MSATETITLPFMQMAMQRELLIVVKLPDAETTKSHPAPTIGHPVDE